MGLFTYSKEWERAQPKDKDIPRSTWKSPYPADVDISTLPSTKRPERKKTMPPIDPLAEFPLASNKKVRINTKLPYDNYGGYKLERTPEAKKQHEAEVAKLRQLLDSINTLRKAESLGKVTKITPRLIAKYCKYQIVYTELEKLGRIKDR